MRIDQLWHVQALYCWRKRRTYCLRGRGQRCPMTGQSCLGRRPADAPDVMVGTVIGVQRAALCAGSGLFARRRSVAGDCYAGFLYHQHLRWLQRHRTVQHPARNRECHTGNQLDGVATLEFNAQATVDDVEELVLLLVLVPVVFATREDAQAEQNAANLDQGLVVPGVVRPLDRFAYIDELKRAEQRLVVDPVVSLLRHMPHSIGRPAAECRARSAIGVGWTVRGASVAVRAAMSLVVTQLV